MASDDDMFGTAVQTTYPALLADFWLWMPYFGTFIIGLSIHELITSTPTFENMAMVIVSCYMLLRSFIIIGVFLVRYYDNYPELRRIAQGFWASRLRGVPFEAPEKYWIHGSTTQIGMRICCATTAFAIGLLSPWRSLTVIGGIEVAILAHHWLLELLCGRYQWKPHDIMTSTQPYQEAAWQFFFRESWMTRRCFGTSFGGDENFAGLLACPRMWWLGYLIMISFGCLCGALSFVASIVV